MWTHQFGGVDPSCFGGGREYFGAAAGRRGAGNAVTDGTNHDVPRSRSSRWLAKSAPCRKEKENLEPAPLLLLTYPHVTRGPICHTRRPGHPTFEKAKKKKNQSTSSPLLSPSSRPFNDATALPPSIYLFSPRPTRPETRRHRSSPHHRSPPSPPRLAAASTAMAEVRPRDRTPCLFVWC